MGVTGLWTVVQGCARPTKLETLNKKRLAVDASIWIYQFLKAVRDKEGKALRNSHIVGFFRRICKLLFFGIKPVFVFDGGAPLLKRQTISNRKSRREGRREDATRTASKLLAIQMQRRAEEEADKAKARRQAVEEEEVPDDLVYVNELGMTEQEKKQSRGFKKKDQYHLPEIDNDMASLGAPDDPRIMSQEELEEYARQFHSGEEINLYDFSKIDFDSPFFVSLPASDRYNILNAARLRSRLRMGYSKEQLESMFPDRMAFSRFQIERVKERNELTQRLMNLNGMNGQDFKLTGRVAGEKGKEYVLVKNDGVEGGWALGVVGNKDGEREQPIDVDEVSKPIKRDDDDWEDEDAFEDVPIEGLNRLPKHPALKRGFSSADDLERRKSQFLSRNNTTRAQPAASETRPSKPVAEDESLFVEGDEDAEFEDALPQDSDNEELQRAIALSLETETVAEERPNWEADMLNGPAPDKPLQYNKKNAKAGRAFAHITNERANKAIPRNPFAQDSDEEEAGGGSLVLTSPRKPKDPSKARSKASDHGFSGPLPFESLSLGKSMLGGKKKKESEAGGFEQSEEKAAEPLPPWFSANLEQSYRASNQREKEDRDLIKADRIQNAVAPILHRQATREVIDVDESSQNTKEVIDVDMISDDDEVEMIDSPTERSVSHEADESTIEHTTNAMSVGHDISMDDIAVQTRVETPVSGLPAQDPAPGLHASKDEEIEWSASDTEAKAACNSGAIESEKKATVLPFAEDDSEDSNAEFEDVPAIETVEQNALPASSPVKQNPQPEVTIARKSPSQDLASATTIDPIPAQINGEAPEIQPAYEPQSMPPPRIPQENTVDSFADDAEFDDFSDPDEVDLLRSLAEEASEHARFAASLADTARSTTKEDYEKELKQLRNQQKKDLRDSDEVTQIMITECQQLLKLFGLPYITAPMEAEAQCAELVTLGLVDGIVTDDSDVFLFGGTRVYKNMFNQAKYVECYLATDLEKEHSLTREKIIQAAHLLGSDYTEGLPHVGPVTAMEILSEFPSLTEFRDWWEQVQTGKKIPGDDKNPFRRKFKKNASKIFLPLGFPDARVDEAYLHPEVDSDPSQFVWGVPDLDALRGYLMATIGWGRERADEILVPVIRDMNRREVEGIQANITRFFSGNVGSGTVVEKSNDNFAPRKRAQKSSRMESALGKIHRKAQQRLQGIEPEDEESQSAPEPKKSKRKKRTVPDEEEESDENNDDDDSQVPPPKKATKRAARVKAV